MQVKDYQIRAQIAKALAHPSRLLILDALQEHELCVCELTKLVGSDQSTVSKHLALLKNAGLIEDHKQGNNIYYRLLCPCISKFFTCLEEVVHQKIQKYQEAGKSASESACKCLRNSI